MMCVAAKAMHNDDSDSSTITINMCSHQMLSCTLEVQARSQVIKHLLSSPSPPRRHGSRQPLHDPHELIPSQPLSGTHIVAVEAVTVKKTDGYIVITDEKLVAEKKSRRSEWVELHNMIAKYAASMEKLKYQRPQ
mmetsp:Transcript_45972/g.85457  ORF Transcript_45972/g.85457 Transcript_45972/m.85457 type:complete len:135 (-) Transcript_45972:1262-1666(-)